MAKRKSKSSLPVKQQPKSKKTRMDRPVEGNQLKRLPITLLSGFLGSGKTTLLEHILNNNDHGLRIAVIVNDMSKLNIDAVLIQKHSIASSREKLIQLQNGCICCTLHSDLLEELLRLAKDGKVDYVVIESTGISEPEQVAETFTAELVQAMMIPQEGAEMDEEETKLLKELADMGGLNAIAYLDTCVTVIDAFNVFANLTTADFLSDRWGGVERIEPEDERTISDLLVDQIEFANVILLNKIDQVDEDMKKRVHHICKTLNPEAKVIETKYSKVDVKEVINTGLYNYEKAATSKFWLKSLQELSLRNVDGKMKMAPKPETEEYGISSFVYTARRPFHPKRLFTLIHDHFILLQNVERYDDDSDDDGPEEEDDEDEKAGEAEHLDELSPFGEESASSDGNVGSDAGNSSSEHTVETEATEVDAESTKSADEDSIKEEISVEEILINKSKHPIFKTMIRSKGFWWHANRPFQIGSWSQAGAILTVEGSGPWWCNLEESDWPNDKETQSLIRADFDGPWGDRRQEIVFIGEKLDPEAITKAFDTCLLNDREFKKWENLMIAGESLPIEELERRLEKVFEDGWEDWATTPLMGEEEGHEGHHH